MLASVRSRWGPYAAPRIFGGRLSGRLPLTLVDLTWARYPQKSQMISAHLKLLEASVAFFLASCNQGDGHTTRPTLRGLFIMWPGRTRVR